MDVLALRDQILDRLHVLVVRLDRDAALVLVVLAERDGAVDFGDDRRFLRRARFEQFRHPRQTAGDVAGLGAFGRDTRDDVAGLDRARRHRPTEWRRPPADSAPRRRARACSDLAVLVLDRRSPDAGPAARLGRAPVDDHALGDAGRLRRAFPTIDWPSTRSSNSTVPSTSVRIGRVYGSHSAMRWPRLTLSPSSTFSRAPYGMRCVARSVPSASTTAITHVAAHRDQIAVRILARRCLLVLDLDLAVEVRTR